MHSLRRWLFVPLAASLVVAVVQLEILTGAPIQPPATRSAKTDGTTIKGKIEFDKQRSKSWNGGELVIPLGELQIKLYEQVELTPVPFPENWKEMKPEEQQAWAKKFEESDAGRKFFADREEQIAGAKEFEVIIEKNGSFVIYDIPPGIYDLRGLVFKDIQGTQFGFEVFGRIDVAKDMDEIRLPPIQIAATPMLKAGEAAPPISVETFDGKNKIELSQFAGNYLLLSFWMAQAPSAEFQTTIQNAFAKIKERYPIRLLSVCVDDDPKKTVDVIKEKELKLGSHGFTRGLEHRTLFDYGIRGYPSFWLISPDGKIALAPGDFATALRANAELSEILANKIEGKDLPTPAAQPITDNQ